MADGLHPAAPHDLPFFVPGPDGWDQMMVTTAIILIGLVLALGVLFFWVHSLPERLAHRSRKVQMEVVAILCLLALFTHVHAFWVAALLLAVIDIPTLANPVERIAGSLERMAGRDQAIKVADPAQPGLPTAVSASANLATVPEAVAEERT